MPGVFTRKSRGVRRLLDLMQKYGPWHGRADVLFGVNTPSKLGKWSYEVYDTKLARETKGGTILQLCLYYAQRATLRKILTREATHASRAEFGNDSLMRQSCVLC
jgi:hypothetical protein